MLLLSTTRLISPRDPPGFSIIIDLDTTRTFRPGKVYLAALTIVQDWAYEGWNHFISSGSPRSSLESYGIVLSFRSIATRSQRYQLQMKYLIIGMLHLIDQMTKVDKFCVSTASVLAFREPVGFIRLGKPRTVDQTNASSMDVVVTKDDTANDTQSQNLTATTRIVDPKDADFAIEYEVKGDAMSCIDLLSAALWAMATAAQAGNDEYCQDLGGFNEKQNVVYRIHGKRPTVSGYILTYRDVRRGLFLLPQRLYGERACGEVQFDFEYRGDILGSGSIDLSDFSASTSR